MPKGSQSKTKRAIPGGKFKKKLVIPGKTTANKPTITKSVVIPGKNSPTTPVKLKPVVLTDDNVISLTGADSRFSKTMIEDVHVVEERNEFPDQSQVSDLGRQPLPDFIADDSELEFLSDQVYAYRELSNVVDKGNWAPEQIIDLMDVFIRAINFDTVSIALIDQRSHDKFTGFISRGNESYPGADTIAYLQQSIVDGAIQWETLLQLSADKDSPFQKWVADEEFECLGFIPIHDGHQILGFILSACRKAYQPSDIASILLEMIGGRLGLSITAQKAYK